MTMLTSAMATIAMASMVTTVTMKPMTSLPVRHTTTTGMTAQGQVTTIMVSLMTAMVRRVCTVGTPTTRPRKTATRHTTMSIRRLRGTRMAWAKITPTIARTTTLKPVRPTMISTTRQPTVTRLARVWLGRMTMLTSAMATSAMASMATMATTKPMTKRTTVRTTTTGMTAQGLVTTTMVSLMTAMVRRVCTVGTPTTRPRKTATRHTTMSIRRLRGTRMAWAKITPTIARTTTLKPVRPTMTSFIPQPTVTRWALA